MEAPNEMQTFVRAVEAGGFTAAAQDLKLTPSAISKIVTRLEDRLGVRLLNRTTRRIALTPEGDIYFRRCQRILADIEDAELTLMQSRRKPQGMLRVNTGVAFGTHQLLPVLPKFLAAYPEIHVELTMVDHLVDLLEEGADVAVRMAPMTDSNLIARKIRDVHRLIVATPAYLKRHGTPRTPADLAQHNCLTFTGNSNLSAWPFRGLGGAIERVPVRGNIETNNADALLRLVLAGLGIGRFTDTALADDIASGRLVPLLTDVHHDEVVPLHALYPHRRFLSPKVEVFVDFLVRNFARETPAKRAEP
jgi:DNA-binding transcriptional LysR family regulator